MNKQPPPDFIEKYRDEIEKCVRCGTCTNICPVYHESRVESMSCRGRLNLLAAHIDGEVSLSRKMDARMRQCVQCLKCLESCPNGIPTDKIFIASWAQGTRERGIPFPRQFFMENIFLNESVMALAGIMSRVFGPLVMKKLPGIPLAKLANRLIPYLAPRAFQDLARENTPPVKGGKRAVFFTGCLVNLVYPSIGISVTRLLAKMGYDVIVPAHQNCCGVPLISLGLADAARKEAEATVKTLMAERPDVIVTACATCASAFKRKYPVTLGEDFEGLGEFVSKIRDISELLSADRGIMEHLETPPERVAYHESCHMRRGIGVVREPRAVIRETKGARLVYENPAEYCCGFGGVFSLDYHGLSNRINARLIEKIAGANPDVIIAGCPACIFQISAGLAREKVRVASDTNEKAENDSIGADTTSTTGPGKRGTPLDSMRRKSIPRVIHIAEWVDRNLRA